MKLRLSGAVSAFALILGCTDAAFAATFNFNGTLMIFDPVGVSTRPSYTGQIDYDSATLTGLANFDTVLFKSFDLTIRDVNLIQTGGIVNAEGTWGWSISSGPISWGWTIAAMPGGATSYSLLDSDGDGIPGTALTSGVLMGFTLAVEGVASPVPIPAATWLFGSGLIGLIGVAKRKKA